MKTHHFTLGQVFTNAWKKTTDNAWFLVCLMVIACVIMGVLHRSDVLSSVVAFVLGIIGITVSLTVSHGNKPSLNDISKSFQNYKITWHFFLASLISGIAVAVGLLLFILPGIYLMVRLGFYKFFIVSHENLGPIEALARSMKITEGHFWKLLGLGIVLLIINIVGLIPFGLGLIITIPFSMITLAEVYKKLTEEVHTEHHHN